MLFLTREAGQKIKIGNNITITVVGIHNRIPERRYAARVFLGVDAPKEIPVLRPEAKVRKKKETR